MFTKSLLFNSTLLELAIVGETVLTSLEEPVIDPENALLSTSLVPVTSTIGLFNTAIHNVNDSTQLKATSQAVSYVESLSDEEKDSLINEIDDILYESNSKVRVLKK